MKLYNEKLNKVIDATQAMAKILTAKGWVELPLEEIPVKPLIESTIEESTNIFIDEIKETPELEPVKPPKKVKTKK